MADHEVSGLRRRLLSAGLSGAALRAAMPLAAPFAFTRASNALGAEGAADDRVLVVLELSGGNDGLNTVVPYADDAYYRWRPKLAIPKAKLRRIDDHYGWSPGMAGFERLYNDGKIAVIHGCGYENPSFSHFTSMAYWHTAAPNSGNEYGWVGRVADTLQPEPRAGFLVDIDETQSLAVRARVHTPVVFNDPEKFVRLGDSNERIALDRDPEVVDDTNGSRRFLTAVAQSARDASNQVREACGKYRTPVDYGILPLDLQRVAALLDARFPARLYYCAFRHNAFDTHVYQADLHSRLLTYVSDAVSGFMKDLERIGQADRVTVLAFSEFGRRVPENANRGTDHGTAGPMFAIGKHVQGGMYGKPVSLTELDGGDNFVHTTDFRRVYASAIEGWLGYRQSETILGGKFETFPLYKA